MPKTTRASYSYDYLAATAPGSNLPSSNSHDANREYFRRLLLSADEGAIEGITGPTMVDIEEGAQPPLGWRIFRLVGTLVEQIAEDDSDVDIVVEDEGLFSMDDAILHGRPESAVIDARSTHHRPAPDSK